MRYITIMVLLLSVAYLGAGLIKNTVNQAEFFQDGYCIQKTVVTPAPETDSIFAYVDGNWNYYRLTAFPKAFMEWNISRRKEYLQIFRDMFSGSSDASPELAGPHNGMVATYGFAREDSQFKLNNAVKGMGFIPRADKIDSLITLLKQTQASGIMAKLDVLEGMYNKAEQIFDLRLQGSLELYAEPKFLTQTFCNQMVNPASTIVFLDIPCYKLKTITRLLDPKDPNLTDYEKKVTEYINLIHSYFHGAFDKEFIAVIYYVVEIYDNSPGNLKARGLQIAPNTLK